MAAPTARIIGAAVALCVAAGLGAVAGWQAREGAVAPARPEPPGTELGAPGPRASELDALEDRLDLESSSRIELATRLAGIEERLADLESQERVADSEPPAREERGLAQASDPRSRRRGGPEAPGTDGQVDVDALVAAGFPRAKAEDVRRLLDQSDLERLYLRDRATREGWVDEPRFRQESRALGNGLGQIRSEYGDDLYDWVLYSSGRPNRVVVDDVISGSAAAEAGLQAGDVVRSYDGAPLFRPRELRNATQGGRAGETVEVEVERDGSVERLFLPRGPLGVRISPDRREPPPAG